MKQNELNTLPNALSQPQAIIEDLRAVNFVTQRNKAVILLNEKLHELRILETIKRNSDDERMFMKLTYIEFEMLREDFMLEGAKDALLAVGAINKTDFENVIPKRQEIYDSVCGGSGYLTANLHTVNVFTSDEIDRIKDFNNYYHNASFYN